MSGHTWGPPPGPQMPYQPYGTPPPQQPGYYGPTAGIKVTQSIDDDPAVAEPVAPGTPVFSTPSVPVATTSKPAIPLPTRATTTRTTSPKPVQTMDPLKFVATHRLYKTGVQQSVNCKEAPVGLANVSKATSYYRAVKACLDRAWPRQVAASGRTFRAPGLLSWVGSANSPCGNSDRSLSFYCPSNHTIYMDVADDVSYWKRNRAFARALASHTVAHEYAHALQQMTGILPAYSRANHGFWSRGAFTSRNVGKCNTFTAGPGKVS
ncbi:neutral zinc metallopeptidase [Kribbella swartbergensis]